MKPLFSMSLVELNDILKNFKLDDPSPTFEAIIESNSYKENATGSSAIYINFCYSIENPQKINEFIHFLFEKECETKVHKVNAMELFFLWVRASDGEEIEAQITCLEELTPQIKILNEQDKGFSIPQLSIVQLLEKCQTHVLPGPESQLNEPILSTTFIKNSNKLIRSNRASVYRGRLHFIASKVFPAFLGITISKKSIHVQHEDSSSNIVVVLKKMASGHAEPLEYQLIDQFLSRAKCVDCNNRILRTPARVLTSLDLIQNQSSPQDAETCLEIAIMAYILNPQSETFTNHVQKFAQLCGANSKLILETVAVVEESTLKPNETPTIPEQITMESAPTSEEGKYEPLFIPFDIEEEEAPHFGNRESPTSDMIEQEIVSFAGETKSKWFDGSNSELSQWRAARLCVAHFMNQLDPNSFSIAEPNEVVE